MNAKQLRQGQDVLFIQSNNEPLPAKLIRPGDDRQDSWHIVAFDDAQPNGTKLHRNVSYSEHPAANHFCTYDVTEQARGQASGGTATERSGR